MISIPKNVHVALSKLEDAGFSAYLVGGCVRDALCGVTPKDWDIATNAHPEQIQSLFEKTVYENTFGTVAVVFEGETDETVKVIEITPFRLETQYSDGRHPDSVSFSNSLEEDLARRDFTINALAMDSKGHITDLFDGGVDLDKKVIRTVGNPDERFTEDALRILRAIRFSVQLGFGIEYETMISIEKHSKLLANISWERKRDELEKIIMSRDPMQGLGMIAKLGMLDYLIPELKDGIGCEQRGEHIYDVFEHLLHALGHAADKEWPLEIRLAALLHDIGKPKTRRFEPRKNKYTFFGHEVVGARMAKTILERLKFPKAVIEKVTKLVRFHMFFSDTETITLSAVRRTIVNVGKENIWDLMRVRECDRVGMKKKEAPYRLRKYHAMIEEALRDPISVGQLVIDGEVLIKNGVKPGPKMGWMLHALLEEVLDDPLKNTEEYLLGRVREFEKMSDSELKQIGEKAREAKEEVNQEEVRALRKKHGV